MANFLLRITDKKLYGSLQKKAKEQRWSVNTLINSILEEEIKKDKKKTDKSLVISD